jgi:3-hydroxybutyryl-CoA dehydratase
MSDIQRIYMGRGLYFEEFQAGQMIRSAARTVTETDVVAFAALSGDWAPIHTDAVYAGQSLYGQRIAHGMLGASLATSLAMRTGILDDTILAFREIRDWKFSMPILLGDTIHVQIKVTETRRVARLGGGLITLEVELINQNEQAVQRGTWVVLVKSKPEEAAQS